MLVRAGSREGRQIGRTLVLQVTGLASSSTCTRVIVLPLTAKSSPKDRGLYNLCLVFLTISIYREHSGLSYSPTSSGVAPSESLPITCSCGKSYPLPSHP